MASKFDRLLKLAEQAAVEPIELSSEQLTPLEQVNPCYRERHVESGRPGELLAQDPFFVGSFKGVGKVYLHTVVDTYGYLRPLRLRLPAHLQGAGGRGRRAAQRRPALL